MRRRILRKPIERLKNKVFKENLWLFLTILLSEKKRKRSELRSLVEKRFHFVAGQVTSYKVLFLLEQGGYVDKDREKRYWPTKKGLKQLTLGKLFLKGILKIIEKSCIHQK